MSQNRLHDFEREMKRKLEDHQLDVPDGLWSAIEQERYPTNKKRWPAFLLIMLLVGLGTAGIWMLNEASTAPIAALEQEEIRNDKAIAISKNTRSKSNESHLQDLPADLQNESQPDYQGTKSKLGQTREASNERWIKSDQQTLNDRKRSGKHAAGVQKQIKSHTPHKGSSQVTYSELNNSTQDQRASQGKLKIANEAVLGNESKSAAIDSRKSTLILPIARANEIMEIDQPVLSPQCPIFSDKGMMTNISLEFGLGPALSFHEVSADPAFQGFLNDRGQREAPLVNYGAHIKVKKEWANNTTASIGFNYTSFNYQYRRVDSNQVRRTVITIDTFYQGHEYTTSIDTLILVENGVQEYKSGMTHRIWSFPVSFGYKMQVDRLFLEPYLGATFNILQEAQLPPEQLLADLVEEPLENVMAYRTNLGVMAHAGLTIGYELNSRWSIILQPEYHQVWNSITAPDMPVRENRNWLNINAGIKYKLWQTKKMR